MFQILFFHLGHERPCTTIYTQICIGKKYIYLGVKVCKFKILEDVSVQNFLKRDYYDHYLM